MFAQVGGELGARILGSSVGMEYRTGSKLDVGRGHGDRLADQVGAHVLGHRPANDSLGMAVDHRGQVELYLATVIDCHTKAVVGWSMAEHMRTDLICEAITMAAANVELAPGAVFHSDRGTQYT